MNQHEVDKDNTRTTMTRKKGAPQRLNEIYEDTSLSESPEDDEKTQQGTHISSKNCSQLEKSAAAGSTATSAVVAVKLQSQRFPATNNAPSLTDRHQSTATTTNGSMATTASPKQRVGGSKLLLQYSVSNTPALDRHAPDPPTTLLSSDKKSPMADSERLAATASPNEADALQTAAKRRCWSMEENDNKTAAVASSSKKGTMTTTAATCGSGGPVTKFRKISQGSSSSSGGGGGSGRSSKLHQQSTNDTGKTCGNQTRSSTTTPATSTAASSSHLSPTQLFFETMLRHQLYEQCQNSWMYAQQQRSDNNCLSKSKAERYRWCVPAPSTNGSNCNHKTAGANSSGGSSSSQKQQQQQHGGGGSGNASTGSGGNHNSSHVSSLKRSANLAGCDVTPMPEKLFSSVFSGASQFSCRDCGSSFDTLVELTVHMSKTDHFRDFNGSSSHNDKSEGSSGGGGNSGGSGGGIPNNKKRRLSEQEERGSENVLTCMECKHSFDSLQDLSVHMMKTRHYENVPSLRPWTQHQHHFGAGASAADGSGESGAGSMQAPAASSAVTSSVTMNRKKMTSSGAGGGGGGVMTAGDKHSNMNGHHHQQQQQQQHQLANGGGVKNAVLVGHATNSSVASSSATTSAAVTSAAASVFANHHSPIPGFNSMLTNLPNASAAAAYYSTMMYFYPWLAASIQNSLLTTSGFPSVPFLPQHAAGAAAAGLFPLPAATSLFGLDERMAQYAAACQLRQLMSGMAGSANNDAAGNKDMQQQQQQQMPSLDAVTAANALKYSKLLFKNQLMSATQLQQQHHQQQRHQQEVAKTESSGQVGRQPPITSPSSSDNTSSPGLSGTGGELNSTQMDFINMLEGTVHSALSKVQTSNAASLSSGAASVLPPADNKRNKASSNDKTSSPALHQTGSSSSLSDSVTTASAIASARSNADTKLLISHPSPSSGRSSVSGVCNSPLDLTLKRGGGGDPTSPTSYTSSKSSPQRGSGANIDLCMTTTTNNTPQRHITRSPSNSKLQHRSNPMIKREFAAYTGTLPPKDPLQSIKEMFETRTTTATTSGGQIERQQLATPPVTCTATNPLREMLRIVNDTDKYSGKLNNVCQPSAVTSTTASAIASTTHNALKQRHNQTVSATAATNQATAVATSDSAKLRLRELFDELVVPPAGSDVDKLNPIYDLQQMVDMKLNAATSAVANHRSRDEVTSAQTPTTTRRSAAPRNNGGSSGDVLSPYRHDNNSNGGGGSSDFDAVVSAGGTQQAVGDACQEMSVKTTTATSSSKSKLQSSVLTPSRSPPKQEGSPTQQQETTTPIKKCASTVCLSEGGEKKAATDAAPGDDDDDMVAPLILHAYFARRYSSLLCQGTTASGGKRLAIDDTVDEDGEVAAVAELTGLNKSCVKTHIRRMIETFNSGSNLPFIKQELQQQQQQQQKCDQQQQNSPTRTNKQQSCNSTVNFHCCVCLKSSASAEDFTKHVEEHHQGWKNAASADEKTFDKTGTANNDATNNKFMQQQKESCNRSEENESLPNHHRRQQQQQEEKDGRSGSPTTCSPPHSSDETAAGSCADSTQRISGNNPTKRNMVLMCSQDSEITTTAAAAAATSGVGGDDVIRVTS